MKHLFLLLLVPFLTTVSCQEISKKQSTVDPVEYSEGVIVEKIFDTRTQSKTLVYQNNNNNVFSIKTKSLWPKADIGDSVRVGYIEKHSFFYILDFLSIEVIKPADTKVPYKIITSEEPVDDTTIIYSPYGIYAW